MAFRNDKRDIPINPFKTKFTFNPRNKYAAIKIYLRNLEVKLLKIEVLKDKFSNRTKGERDSLYNLKNDKTIVIKSADKGSVVVIWDREDYIKEAKNQLGDTNICEEVPNDTKPLMNIILNTSEKICKRGHVFTDTLNYFLIKDAKLARVFLLRKIYKRLYNVPGRPVISNCGYYTENISTVLDFDLQPIAKKVKSYIKGTNDFLEKLRSLTNLPGNSFLCTMDVVGLYPNIPHDEGLPALRERFNDRDQKDVPTDTLVELAELVLRNSIFNFNQKTLKQKRGTTMGTKFASPYSILLMAQLEEIIL